MSGLFGKLFSWLFKAKQPSQKAGQPSASPRKPELPTPPPPADKVVPSAYVTPESVVEPTPTRPEEPVRLGVSPSPSEAIVDLHVGLDLGTSCSKIVIGDAFLDRCRAVEFNNAASGVNKYLFPTRFFETQSLASLTRIPNSTSRSNLKLQLVDAVAQGTDTLEVETDLAIYLALLLEHSFNWFTQNAAADHRNRRCCWWLNVGFPAKRIDGTPLLLEAYTRACTAAVCAVDSGKPICRPLIRRCMGAPSSPTEPQRIASERIHLYPEIAAQLAGYAYSPYRRDGPLLLLDIGAGTLDISTLILHHRNGEEVCSFHFCQVAPLGAFRLYEETHRAMSHVSAATMAPLVSASDDPAWRPPASSRKFLIPNAHNSPDLDAAFHNARASFAKRCLDTCQANFSRFKAHLDEPFLIAHRRPRAFRAKVNFILSGGGSRAQFYHRLFPDELEERILNLTSWHMDKATRKQLGQGLQRIYFSQPDHFQASGIATDDFDRLSVAHGLSMGVETLMRITAKEGADRL